MRTLSRVAQVWVRAAQLCCATCLAHCLNSTLMVAQLRLPLRLSSQIRIKTFNGVRDQHSCTAMCMQGAY